MRVDDLRVKSFSSWKGIIPITTILKVKPNRSRDKYDVMIAIANTEYNRFHTWVVVTHPLKILVAINTLGVYFMSPILHQRPVHNTKKETNHLSSKMVPKVE